MIRIIAFLILTAAIGAGFAWLADRPGEVVLVWQDYRVQTNLVALAIAALALCVVAVILWQVYRLIVGGPRAVGDFFRHRRQMRGYRALSQGMIAIGAGDVRLAEHHAGEAQKLLRNEPLTGLLGAQAAQLAGRDDQASQAFADMLGEEQTVLLGLHGLFVQADRVGDQEAADLYAEEAVKRSPGLAWAANAVFLTRTRTGDWTGALDCLDRNRRYKVVDKKTGQRLRAVLLTATALRDEDTAPEAALNAALEAHKLAPDLVPAAVVAGRVAAQLGKFSKATQILERSWKLSPHPDIAAVYTHMRAGDSTQDRLERARALSKKLPGNAEGRRALARAAIDARDFALAREALALDTRDSPQRSVCLMMAEIENEETGDTGRVRQWLARALRAPRDPAWVADGHVTDVWAPTSPVTGRPDAYVWTVPPDDKAEQATILDAAVEPDAAPLAPPAPMIDVSPRAMQPATEPPADAAATATAATVTTAAKTGAPSETPSDTTVETRPVSIPADNAPAPAPDKAVDGAAQDNNTAGAAETRPVDAPPAETQTTAGGGPEDLAAKDVGTTSATSQDATASATVDAAETAKQGDAAPVPGEKQTAAATKTSDTKPADTPSAAAPATAAAPRVAPMAAQSGQKEAGPASTRSAEDDDVVVFPPPPDDPGPDGALTEDDDKRRFGPF